MPRQWGLLLHCHHLTTILIQHVFNRKPFFRLLGHGCLNLYTFPVALKSREASQICVCLYLYLYLYSNIYSVLSEELTVPNLSWYFPQLYNGPNDQAPLIGSYCGNTPPPANTTTSSSLHMVFHTDSSIAMTGFQMLWYQNGETTTTTNSCTTTQPQYYK